MEARYAFRSSATFAPSHRLVPCFAGISLNGMDTPDTKRVRAQLLVLKTITRVWLFY